MKPKAKASNAMSRYCRLRDALEYCNEYGIDLTQFNRPEDIIGKCCTSSTVKSWVYMDAGHFIGRGIGGGSGVYFDERNVHLQSKRENAFAGGNPTEYRKFMLEKYGQDVIDELERKHMIPIDFRDLAMKAMEIHYKTLYKELVEQNGL